MRARCWNDRGWATRHEAFDHPERSNLGVKAVQVDDPTKTLEERLAHTLRENESMRAALEEAQASERAAHEELRLFAYATSHDLQEPLRSISSYAQLLQRQYGGTKESAEYTTFIVDAVNRMTALIRDLLAYSRLAKPQRRSVALAGLVQWAMMSLDVPIREAHAKVTYDGLPEVQVDETQTVQLLQQLFANAIKFKSEAVPEIIVTAEEADDAYIVSVQDNGVGIEPKYRDQIFGVFKRLHGREVPGTGIGLALCRKIVEGHGGKIWVESGEPQGSVFKFTLPF